MISYHRAAVLPCVQHSGAWGREGLRNLSPPGNDLAFLLDCVRRPCLDSARRANSSDRSIFPLIYAAASRFSKDGAKITLSLIALYPYRFLLIQTAAMKQPRSFLCLLLFFLYTSAISNRGWKATSFCIALGIALGATSSYSLSPVLLPLFTLITEASFSGPGKAWVSGFPGCIAIHGRGDRSMGGQELSRVGRFCLIFAQAGNTL